MIDTDLPGDETAASMEPHNPWDLKHLDEAYEAAQHELEGYETTTRPDPA